MNWKRISIILFIVVVGQAMYYSMIIDLKDETIRINNENLELASEMLKDDRGVPNCSSNVYNCDDFNTRAEAQAVMEYCGVGDIHHLDGDSDGIACESLSYSSSTTLPKTQLNYSCNNVGEQITKEQVSYGTENQPLQVTLTKVCSADFEGAKRIRVYWMIENKGDKNVFISPKFNTFVAVNSRQYEASYYSDSSDDALDFVGDLRPGLISEGGINVDEIPTLIGNIGVILEVSRYEDFIFKNIKIN